MRDDELHLIYPWEDPASSRTPELCVREFRRAGSRVISTDTYFNRFPIGLWNKHASYGTPVVRITGANGRPVELVLSRGAYIQRHRLIVSDDDAMVDLAHIDVDMDFAWLEVTVDDEADISGLRVEFLTRTRPRRPTNLLVGFVVFNHPDRAALNTRAVLDSFPHHGEVQVLLVDQGAGNDWSEFDGDSRVTVRHQANLGGSGGFARIFLEAAESEHTAVIVMDDDTVLGAQTLRRMALLRAYSVQALVLAAQSLNERERRQLRSDAERLDVPALWARPTNWSRRHVDANERPALTGLLADHSPWVCALFPVELVRRNGFPLPIFIHWDDLEYSWRLRKDRGPSFLWVPGAGVWHEPPSVKSPWTFMSYFDNRNRLIGGSVVGLDDKALRKHTYSFWQRALLSHRYPAAASVENALKDFMTGPSVLDQDQLARARSAFSQAPECDCAVGDLAAAPVVEGGSTKILMLKRLFGRAPAAPAVRVAAGQSGNVAVIAGHRHVHVRRPYSEDTEVLSFSRSALWRGYVRGRWAFLQLRFRQKKAADTWREQAPELRSAQRWWRVFSG